MKRSLIYVFVALLSFSACSKDDEKTGNGKTETPFDQLSIDEQVAKIKEMPYASLTPDQQKVKLEQDGMDFMKEMDKTKTSVNIKTLQNLQDLLNKSEVDLSKEKSKLAILKTRANSDITEILNITDIFGIFTWNTKSQSWDETKSTKELKFLFPSTEKGAKNDAELLVTGKSSTVSFTETDDYWDWEYNETTGKYEDISKDFIYFIPETANAILKIDGVEVATSNLKNTFTAGKKAPSETVVGMNLSDGYKLSVKGVKGTNTTITSDFTFGETVLYSAIANTSTNIDALIEKDSIPYYGAANAYVKIMSNLAIISEVNFSAIATEDKRIEKDLPTINAWNLADTTNPNNKNKDVFKQASARNKAIAEAEAKATNDYNKSYLVSRVDGTKIATVIAKVVRDDYSPSSYYSWNNETASWERDWENTQKTEYYEVVLQFKFNDNTIVDADTFFGKGFEALEKKFREFTTEFNIDID